MSVFDRPVLPRPRGSRLEPDCEPMTHEEMAARSERTTGAGSNDAKLNLIYGCLAFILLVSGAVFGKYALRSDQVITVTKTRVARVTSASSVTAALGKPAAQLTATQLAAVLTGQLSKVSCGAWQLPDGYVFTCK